MKSAIFLSLVAATGLKDTDPTNVKDMKKLIISVGKDLSDKAWAGLSNEAQDWYNTAADAVNDDKPIPAFPDAEEEAAAPRRRAAPAADASPETSTGGPDILKVGQVVEIENKRGKVFKGTVTELNDDEVVLGEGEDAEELDIDKIVKVKVLEDVKAAGRRSTAKDDEPDAGAAEPAVGDEVELTNKRGKVFTGTITELSAEEIVIETADGIEDFDREKVTGIKVLKKAKAAAAKDDKPARRGAAKKEDDEKPTRSSNPAGVSVGGRIREIMCEDLGISEEAVGKALEKDKIEFRPPTLKMIYKDTKAVIDLLIENKHMKAPK